jgi:bifunctional non-homologous end joining protein LigD
MKTSIIIPTDQKQCRLSIGGKKVQLTNLQKPFWPELGLRKGDLLRYYAEMGTVLLPYLRDRAMVMKRYPHGWNGPFFFMKRAPEYRPEWLRTCSIEHKSASVIDFPVIDDPAALLWVINLGCIDLNPWYSRCDDIDRPDYLHFDLDPTPEAGFDKVRETALIVRDALVKLGMKPFAKTTGASGIHVYVGIKRGPLQKEVWTFAKALAQTLAKQHPRLITAEYLIKNRPAGHVLVDYNQNAWGKTLASVYSVRPQPHATVSAPVTWEEIEAGVRVEDFTLQNVPARVRQVGDLWKPLTFEKRGRFDLAPFITPARARSRARTAK